VCPSKERLPGVPPGPRIRFSAAWCSMSRATPASTAVPPCTSATIVSTASTPCRAPWSCPVAWLTAPTAFARFAAKPSAAELLLGSCALRSATPRGAAQYCQPAPPRRGKATTVRQSSSALFSLPRLRAAGTLTGSRDRAYSYQPPGFPCRSGTRVSEQARPTALPVSRAEGIPRGAAMSRSFLVQAPAGPVSASVQRGFETAVMQALRRFEWFAGECNGPRSRDRQGAGPAP